MRYYQPIFMVKVLCTNNEWCPALKHTYKHSTLEGYDYSEFIFLSQKQALEVYRTRLIEKEEDIKAIKLVELNYLNPLSESRVIEYREF